MPVRAAQLEIPSIFIYLVALTTLCVASTAWAIKDEDNQGRWEKPCTKGPDAVVPGFLVNMGPTGARGILKSQSYVVKFIFPGSPAAGVLQVGDEVLGANGKLFSQHTFGGGSLGIEGPLQDLGLAIEDSEGRDGILKLSIKRGSSKQQVDIQLEKLGRFADTFPVNCKKTEILKARAYRYLINNPGGINSQARCIATLSMLSSDDPHVFAAGRRMALDWNKSYDKLTWSWHLGFQGITLSEYYLLTGDSSVLGTLQSTMDLLRHGQWQGPKIDHWKVSDMQKPVDQETLDKHQALYEGGFGHAPYFYVKARGGGGYGPMQWPTCLALMTWQLGQQCGLKAKHPGVETGFQFLEHGTTRAGKIAYGGEFTLNNGPVDPVRWQASTRNGASHKSGLGYLVYKLSPDRPNSSAMMNLHLSNIDAAFRDMPNGHACAMMGMTWGLAGTYASDNAALKKKITDYYKAWFNLARCHGSDSYVILPGRDYADESYYRGNIRNHTTAAMAFIYSFSTPKCQVQGVGVSIPGVNHLALQGTLANAYRSMVAQSYGTSAKALTSLPEATDPESDAGKMLAFINKRAEAELQSLKPLGQQGKWFTLQQDLKKALSTYSGVPAFDQQAAKWSAVLDSPQGKQIIAAHKLILDGDYGEAITALQAIQATGFMANTRSLLEAEAVQATQQYVEQSQKLFEEGEWNTLQTSLARQRRKLTGTPLFDDNVATWDAALTSKSGRSIVTADKMIGSGKLSVAAKALANLAEDDDADAQVKEIAAKLQAKLTAQAEGVLESLREYEQQGDWYTLSRELAAADRNLRGIAAFDEQSKAWKTTMRTPEAKEAITLGRAFKTLEVAWTRTKHPATKQKLEAFAQRYPDSFYGKRAKALLAE